MRPPAFWRRPGAVTGKVLAPLGALYGAIAASRLGRRPEVKASVPVLCIGNLVAGGQGKTPAAIAVAGLLARTGRTPAFLSRGYGGRERGPLLVEPGRHRAEHVGDEPLLLARHYPTVVSRDKPEGAERAISHGAGVIVMDDGFQNPALAKTVSLLVVDAAYGIGNGRVLPAGPLRAPLGAQLARADALLLVGPGVPGFDPAGLPVFRAALRPEDPDAFAGRRVLAYAGIGRPEKFFDTLRALGADIVVHRSFPDHHAYTPRDAADLLVEAEGLGAELVTTEKDMARMAGAAHLAALAAASRVLPVALVFDEPAQFADWLLPRLGAA